MANYLYNLVLTSTVLVKKIVTRNAFLQTSAPLEHGEAKFRTITIFLFLNY